MKPAALLFGLAGIVFVLWPQEAVVGPVFTDVAARSGIQFRHDNAASAEKYLIETMGGGAAWIDYDNDGRLDIYLVNSAATKVYQPRKPPAGALYRNLGDGMFEDVTAAAGIAAEGLFGMGVAVGDYDNDGYSDLYVAGYGRSILYRNEGNGKFKDVTAHAGVGNTGKWASSAAWFDYNRDGHLDLVIANYLDWTPATNLYCGTPEARSYCHPNKYKGQPPTLYKSDGNGGFTDVSRESGIGAMPGNGLGIVCFDFNSDGWQDVLIANDSMANFLFVNEKGTFKEVAISAGVAFGENGEAEAGMGVDAADYDNDGWPDVFITHLDLEFARLYRHNRKDGFEDATFRAGIGYQMFHMSGFGTGLIDYDNDGWRDIFVVNGHVLDNVHLFHPKTTHAEPKFVFRNVGGKFENVTGRLGADLQAPRVSRAAAFADYDNDGDIDVLVSNNGQAPQLLRNEGGNRSNWLQVQLIGVRSNRDGVGAKVTVTAGELKLVEERKGGASYQAAHDPRVHFGLGRHQQVDLIEVRWPSGVVDRIAQVTANRVVVVKEGAGAGVVDTPESHDRRGVSLAQSGQLQSAIEAFQTAIRLKPDFGDAHYHLGLAHDRTGNVARALSSFETALSLQPGMLAARYQLAASCRKVGDTDGATRLLQEIVRGAPEFAEARYNLALILTNKEQFAEAVEHLQAASRLQPKNQRILTALGIALFRQQNSAEAISTLEKAAAIDGSNPEIHYNIGLALANLGQLGGATQAFRRALDLNGKHAQARRALGVSLMQQDKLDEALKELELAVASAPSDDEAYSNIGLVQLRRKQISEAIGALETAVRINPALIKAYFNLAQAYQRASRAEDAKRATERARSLTAEQRNLGRSAVLVQSGREKLRAGERSAALTLFREAVTLSPHFVDARINYGRALRDAGDSDAALREFREVLSTNATDGIARYEIGLTLERSGRRTEARDEFRAAVHNAPCLPPARRALAFSALEAGERETAIEHLRGVLAWEPGDVDAKRAIATLEQGRPK